MPIGFVCATSAKYDQMATLLRQGYDSLTDATENPDPNTSPSVNGKYVMEQHPVTGEIIRVWRSDYATVEDNPSTPEDESLRTRATIEFPCQARGIITGGLNSQGTTERWTSKGTYENVDFIELQVPKHILITKRDRITNVRDSRGNIIWREEEFGSFKPTVFDVRGVTPSLDPFGSLVEYFVLLERAEIQGGREGSNG